MDNQTLNSMAKYYTEWWENPSDPRGQVFAKLNKLVESRIPDGHGKTALDLGSGGGAIIEMLLKKGYNVTSIEYNEAAVKKLKERFPDVNIIQADLNVWQPEKQYDLVTALELVQNFTPEELTRLIAKMHQAGNKVLTSMPNLNSLQGRWVTWRKFKASFVHLYTVPQFENIIAQNNFKIVYRSGVGFLMPITLLNNFRIKLIPRPIVNLFNKVLDPMFPKLCGLYYVELN